LAPVREIQEIASALLWEPAPLHFLVWGWVCVAAPSTAMRNLQHVFSVELAKLFSNVPGDLLVELGARLREIGETLGTLPTGSHVWSSLAASGMLLELGGWRFQYRVDVEGRRLIVEEATYRGGGRAP
jgi:hypothetical protein